MKKSLIALLAIPVLALSACGNNKLKEINPETFVEKGMACNQVTDFTGYKVSAVMTYEVKIKVDGKSVKSYDDEFIGKDETVSFKETATGAFAGETFDTLDGPTPSSDSQGYFSDFDCEDYLEMGLFDLASALKETLDEGRDPYEGGVEKIVSKGNSIGVVMYEEDEPNEDKQVIEGETVVVSTEYKTETSEVLWSLKNGLLASMKSKVVFHYDFNSEVMGGHKTLDYDYNFSLVLKWSK